MALLHIAAASLEAEAGRTLLHGIRNVCPNTSCNKLRESFVVKPVILSVVSIARSLSCRPSEKANHKESIGKIEIRAPRACLEESINSLSRSRKPVSWPKQNSSEIAINFDARASI